MRGRGGLLRFQINSYFSFTCILVGSQREITVSFDFNTIYLLWVANIYETTINTRNHVFSDLQRKILVDQIFVFVYLCICCREEFMSSFLIISNIKLLLFSSYMIIGLSCHFSLFLFSMTPNNFNRINNATVFQILFQTEMIPWLWSW